MLTKGIVSYARIVDPLFVLVLAVWSPAPLRAAAATYDNPVSQNAVTAVDRLLSVSVSEQTDHVSTVADVNEPVAVQSLVYTPDGGQDSDDFNTVARHRGFRKFFLLVFICGAVIRFFTSPTFVTFITDALDPKSW
jgi:hypothetical protein